MKKINIIRTCVLSILSIFLVSSASATLITNGDFSSGLSGWQTSGDVTVGTAGPGMDGDFALISFSNDISPVSRLWQNFDVSGLNQIQITFDWFFEYTDNSRNSNDVFVSILKDLDSSPVQNITLDRLRTNATPRSDKTNLFSGTFNGLIDVSEFDSDARLQFRVTDNNGFLGSWAGIDNVSVSPVPEPTTILLFGAGLAGLIAVQRRKQK
ncbi:PEP-CTERM sorting domain-containing protein [Desulforhopalus sp. IMCC35007]|uniref:PEP-CTERM sorting domain-containing protein n=1 Tax=Desulforhopalus sp. IMCC35007 TaxID=2569543 RepID=UPI0010AEBB2C|nr:PEP-CTERM sorting domain-containing protein [Desulforhopalus sp. IMCC35007]TKB07291.1 PEP-CTERM sorting domain-containing protein [Desulforhopalus sp. IMCC35007]